ncbi:MAG: lysozyme inhibitor LprI family protein [Campylobacterota bacterium]|nr:lysozyme inhibitor LprI family protein [Campylobacterota bacterium]
MLNGFKIALLSIIIVSSSYAASFDCRKASTQVEHLICGDSELSYLDEELLRAYKNALKKSDPNRVKSQQRRWLKYTRNDCTTLSCLKDVYKLQIDRLNGSTLRVQRSRSKWAGEYKMDSDDLTIEPSLHFSYNSIGGNMHLCNIEGKFREVMGKLKFSDNPNNCHITVQYTNPQTIHVDISQCRYYCGMSAFTTSGNFTK